MKEKIIALIALMRVNQWIKNLSIFAAVIFTGNLFNFPYLILSVCGMTAFCLLSSASYVFNDIIDAPLDRLHPIKKYRAIASGKVSKSLALKILFLLTFFGLISALILSFGFFLIALTFLAVHFFYSLYFKKHALLDILSISASFLLRVIAGEVLTSLHVPVWLLLTTLFLALFIASSKRHAEFLRTGAKTRPALERYREKLLDFYTSTFATAAFLSYALFTFLEKPPQFSSVLGNFLSANFPHALGRKWMMLTIPFVIAGIMRYGQLVYEGKKGETPEKIITQDKTLISIVLGWGIMVVLIIYVI